MDYQVGYIWSDGKIITQSLGLIVRGTSGSQVTETQINIDSKYVYEEGSNSPYAAMFSGSEYLFVKNAQGDVTAIVNSENGETIAEYQYDPWGQVTTVYGENTNDLEKAIVNAVCPLTYRGYNYDFTTGLYYLQSRYYSPEWGRFLNVDDVKILASSADPIAPNPLSSNPYLYCNNNPVNRVDYTGELSLDINIDLTSLGGFLSLLLTMSALMQFDSMITIGSDKEDDKPLYKDSKKGAIKINIVSTIPIYIMRVNLSDMVYYFYKKYQDLAFLCLSVFATIKFSENFAAVHNKVYKDYPTGNREFLFDDEFVANEIKQHFLAYWWAVGKIKVTDSSMLLVVGKKFNKSEIIKTCSVIDIYEQDAAKIRDRTGFGYFSGIREKYKYTKADPYWHFGKVRTYQNVREDWKTSKIPDNI